jgi:serpin B
VFVSNASHATTVKVDENGCVGAAYTVMALSGSALFPEEIVEFVLDRPFIFVVADRSGLPLFIGTVVEP